MVQDVTAHSGREKYPNYHFLRVLSQERRGYAVTRLLLDFSIRVSVLFELYIIYIL